jgi:hypothetical protein
MLSFVTYSDLRRLNKSINEGAILAKAARASIWNSTFLSYSSKDFEFLPAIIDILEKHGTNVYIDKIDERLPETPNEETGKILKDSINKCHRFILFITRNSKDSNWIPWELGLADGNKGQNNVALFPASDYYYEQNWSEQEYLGIYSKILWGNFQNSNPEWLVYNHHNNTAQRLREWMQTQNIFI